MAQVWRAAAAGHSYQLDPPAPVAIIRPGRCLGAMFDMHGTLWVANTPLGLLRVEGLPGSSSGGSAGSSSDAPQIVLATSTITPGQGAGAAGGGFDARADILLADGLDIGADGTVYFTDAANIPAKRCVRQLLLAHAPGQLLLAHGPSQLLLRPASVLLPPLHQRAQAACGQDASPTTTCLPCWPCPATFILTVCPLQACRWGVGCPGRHLWGAGAGGAGCWGWG